MIDNNNFPTGKVFLTQALAIFRKNSKKFILLELIPFIGIIPLAVITLLAAIIGNYADNSSGFFAAISLIIALGMLGSLAILVVVVITTQFTRLLLVCNIDSGKNSSIKQVFYQATPYFWHFCWLGLISTAIIVGGLFLLIVPGIIFAIWLSQSYYVLAWENKRGIEAVRRSRQLVFGYIDKVLFKKAYFAGIVLLIIIPLLIFYAILYYNLDERTTGIIMNIVAFVVGIFLRPIGAIYSYLIYKHLRDLKR